MRFNKKVSDHSTFTAPGIRPFWKPEVFFEWQIRIIHLQPQGTRSFQSHPEVRIGRCTGGCGVISPKWKWKWWSGVGLERVVSHPNPSNRVLSLSTVPFWGAWKCWYGSKLRSSLEVGNEIVEVMCENTTKQTTLNQAISTLVHLGLWQNSNLLEDSIIEVISYPSTMRRIQGDSHPKRLIIDIYIYTLGCPPAQ